MGDGDSESWLKVLTACQQLDVQIVVPGHGPLGGKELLEEQKQYFMALRQHVSEGIATGKTLDEMKKSIQVPEVLKKYQGGSLGESQIEKIYQEMIEPQKQ